MTWGRIRVRTKDAKENSLFIERAKIVLKACTSLVRRVLITFLAFVVTKMYRNLFFFSSFFCSMNLRVKQRRVARTFSTWFAKFIPPKPPFLVRNCEIYTSNVYPYVKERNKWSEMSLRPYSELREAGNAGLSRIFSSFFFFFFVLRTIENYTKRGRRDAFEEWFN